MEGHGVAFSMDQGLLTKLDFAKNVLESITIFVQKTVFLSFGDVFTFSNACAIQINLGTN